MTTVMNGAPRATVYDAVVDVVADRTLYDPSCLLPDSHLEGELGIDSVIMESILEAIRTRFGLARELPRTASTIRELAETVELAVPAAPAAAAAPPAPTDSPARPPEHAPQDDPALRSVLAATIRHTRYQRDQLDLDAALESELGIDSVVLESILTDVADELGAAAETRRPARADSLRDLVEHFRRYAPGPQAPQPRPEPWDDRSMKDFAEQRDKDLFAKARSFASYFRGRTQEQLYWYGMPLQSRCRNRAVIHDELTGRTREYLMFASNNYLGLANHPRVIEAICDATGVYGATNTGCRLIGGTNRLHKELERRLAAFKQRPACIVFPSGYSANVGTLSALAGRHDTIVVDKYNHMSIVDGVRLSGAHRKIYQHNDMADLERVLERGSGADAGTLIVADGVFSMHGDICNLPEIVRLARAHGARVLIDDAHATGVLGARGSGTAEHFGMKGQVDLELGTMSKALAGMGGFVAGDEDVIEYLRFYANSYVFAATIPAGVAAGLIAAIDVLESEPERLQTLWSNIRLLRSLLLDHGFDTENSDSAVIPIVIRDERKAMEMGRAVRARGLFCQTVVYPGVALGDARLRVSVTCEHTEDDLRQAAAIFAEAAAETGAPRPGATARAASS
jgi:glycine C-acetyltransferase